MGSGIATGLAIGVGRPSSEGRDALGNMPISCGQPGDMATSSRRAGAGVLALAARDASDEQRERARVVELRLWAAWRRLATRER